MCNVGLLHEICPALPPKRVLQSAQGRIFWVPTGHKWGQVFKQTLRLFIHHIQKCAVSYSTRQKNMNTCWAT